MSAKTRNENGPQRQLYALGVKRIDKRRARHPERDLPSSHEMTPTQVRREGRTELGVRALKVAASVGVVAGGLVFAGNAIDRQPSNRLFRQELEQEHNGDQSTPPSTVAMPGQQPQVLLTPSPESTEAAHTGQ